MFGIRWLAWFTAGFAGVCLACGCGPAGLPGPLAAALCAAVLLTCALRYAFRARPDLSGRALSLLRRVLTLSLGGIVAAGWMWGWTALLRAPAEELAGQTLELSGTVTSWPSDTSVGGQTVTVKLDSPAADLLVYAGGDWAGLRPGDRVTFTARLSSAGTVRGDETTYYTAKGVFLLGYAEDGPPTAAERPDRVPARFWPLYCASALKASLTTAFDGTAAPLAIALVTGDRSGLPEGLSAYMSRTGTAHAAVVSGMHVTTLVAVFMALTRRRKRAAVAVLPALLFYALMTGGAPSVLRALVMQVVLLLAPFAKREYDPPTALAAALLVLLLQNPYAAASVSLQLSFTAVAGILTVTPRLLKRWKPLLETVKKRRGKVPYRALYFVTASLAVSIGGVAFSQPVLAFYFGRASLVFPLTNLLILWAVQGLLMGALLTGLLGLLLPGPAWVLGRIFGLLGHYIAGVVTLTGRWRFASVNVEEPFWLVFVIAVWAVPALCLLPWRERPRPGTALLCLGALFGAALGLTRLPAETSLLTAAALNVGQGSATAFLSGGRTCLVDCGGNLSDSAGDIAADYFAAMGIARLDLLVVTHFDADHVNGLERLFDRMKVQAVALPETGDDDVRTELLALAEAEGAEVVPVTETVCRPLGKATVTLYPPLGAGTSNEAGLFALCSSQDVDVLVTGDADQFVEKMLIKYYDIPDLELLVGGHHGSKTSTSSELLDNLRPELVLFSVGWNSYGQPSEETLERLAERGIPALRTDELGTVKVYVSETGTGYGYRVETG